MKTTHSTLLDHIAEVVYLVKQIDLTKKTEEALQDLDSGNKESIQTEIGKISQTLQATVLMLKGLETDKEGEARRRFERSRSQSSLGLFVTSMWPCDQY